MNQIDKIAVGGSGLVATELVPIVGATINPDLPAIAQIVVQVIIGIATLIGLFKKKK